MATRAPARIMSSHSGGTGVSTILLDMVRSPWLWRGEPLSGPHESRLEQANFERLTPRREAWQCDTPAASLRQEEGGIAATGIETAEVLC